MAGQEVYDPQAALTPIEEPQRRRSTLLTGEPSGSGACYMLLGSGACWHHAAGKRRMLGS